MYQPPFHAKHVVFEEGWTQKLAASHVSWMFKFSSHFNRELIILLASDHGTSSYTVPSITSLL
jgi:hypothetical protein